MQIRKAKAEELDSILDIYSGAREFMRSTGNVEQWSGNYPGKQDILSDIEQGALYLCCEGEEQTAIGLFEHKGVAMHPGDKGMEMIAERIAQALLALCGK